MCCDKTAALSLCQDHKEGQPMQHIDATHHFQRDVKSGELAFVLKSEMNIMIRSNCFTKAVRRSPFEKCLVGMGML
jgi:hypothetical protein